tara:strand:+ start:1634 stop:2578 length:945 start_codon:yes stop_codon:yes gene_type:complete
MNILILGGCGYVGSKLVLKLSENKNLNIKVIDTEWFGNNISYLKKIKFVKKDIRELKDKDFKNIDTVIHLANIANDPAADLNQILSWEVNVLSTKLIADLCIKNKVKQIIYASSGSVYGIKKEKKVTEDLDLLPISIYNKTKMIAERILLSYLNKLKIHIIRPATVCGWSPRMRLDLSVNMLTLQAQKNNLITVFGGRQIRPNIYIDDLVDIYNLFINKKNIPVGIYNAGFENISILKIAKIISSKTGANIKITNSNDPRSYRLDSSKLLKVGFEPRYDIAYAIDEFINMYNNNIIQNTRSSYTVNWMKKLKIK